MEPRQCRDEVKVNACLVNLEEVIFESNMPNILVDDFVRIKS